LLFSKICRLFDFQGTLPKGKDKAVKRLLQNPGQGLNKLKNEVILIVKLQHCNLVKLLGCCIQENENMLVYEYMPNKSLHCFIFGLNLDLDLIHPIHV
jgi:serine/threonine protein kinase